MAGDFDWHVLQDQMNNRASFDQLQEQLKQIKDELSKTSAGIPGYLVPSGTTWTAPNPTITTQPNAGSSPGWGYPIPQPLPPAHGHQTSSPPPGRYPPHDPNYAINIVSTTAEIPFRQVKVLTPYGEFGVPWFDWEGLEVALERLAGEIRRIMSASGR